MSNGIIKHKVEQGDNIGDYVCHLDGWTTEPPTEPGWYWINAVIAGYDIKLVIQYPLVNYENIDKITHWIGPLPPPEPPEPPK